MTKGHYWEFQEKLVLRPASFCPLDSCHRVDDFAQYWVGGAVAPDYALADYTGLRLLGGHNKTCEQATYNVWPFE